MWIDQAIAALTRGTAATSSPDRELGSRSSAVDSRTHGMASSTTVYTTSGRQRASTGRSSPRTSAIGTRMEAPMAVRKNTSVAGVSSRTATLISRYGRPQITHIAAKSIVPRRLTPRS